MRRLVIGLMVIAVGGIILTGCGPSEEMTETVSPLPTPAGHITSPVATPLPDLVIPTPSRPNRGVVFGTLLREIPGVGTEPMAGYTVYLAQVVYSEDGRPVMAAVGDDSPAAVTDEAGRFIFIDIRAKMYGFAIATPLGSALYEPPDGGDFLFTVESGQVLDLGVLITDIPY